MHLEQASSQGIDQVMEGIFGVWRLVQPGPVLPHEAEVLYRDGCGTGGDTYSCAGLPPYKATLPRRVPPIKVFLHSGKTPTFPILNRTRAGDAEPRAVAILG